jgi:hypothetical protein
MFLTRDSPASLPDGSGCLIRMIIMSVLRQEGSHLLLIRTNLGCGTVLTALAPVRAVVPLSHSFDHSEADQTMSLHEHTAFVRGAVDPESHFVFDFE